MYAVGRDLRWRRRVVHPHFSLFFFYHAHRRYRPIGWYECESKVPQGCAASTARTLLSPNRSLTMRSELYPGHLLVASAYAACTAAMTSGVRFQQTQFVIGGGPDPPPTNVSYANLEAGGVTFVHADSNQVTGAAGAVRMAALCGRYNLSCVRPLAGLDAVPPGPAVWGYFCTTNRMLSCSRS